jgi:predicted XRE-type DNA-binding protein
MYADLAIELASINTGVLMRGKETMMTEIRQIIHRLRQGQSQRTIHKHLRVYRPMIKELYRLSIKHQWLDSKLPMPNDEQIATARKEQMQPLPPRNPLEPFHKQIEQWDAKNISSVVIKQLLHDKYRCDVQAIRRYRKKHFPKLIDPVMVRSTVPGQDLELDFGELGRFLDEKREVKRVWLFSFRLRHSRKAYREITLDQKTQTFLLGHIHAFERFNGVPTNCIPDNLKAAVIKPSIDNDGINRSYQELAEHYGFVINPCLPRTPEHKGGVEGDVKYVKRNFLPYFLAKQREMRIAIPTISDLTEALAIWEKEVADIHLIHGIGRSPLDLFRSEEEKALRPLPKNRFDPAVWSQCVVQREWRIMVECSYYSVPCQLIGETVEVRMGHSWVRIFHKHLEVALHEKGKEKWSYQRKSEHAPPLKEAVLHCSREGLLALAQEIGASTYQVSMAILAHPSVDKLKPVRYMLKLSEKYSKERLEKACERAFTCKTCSYKSVKTILALGLDSQAIETSYAGKITPIQSYRFARDPADYKSSFNEKKSETFNEKFARLHPVSKHGNGMAGAWEGKLADRMAEESNNETGHE